MSESVEPPGGGGRVNQEEPLQPGVLATLLSGSIAGELIRRKIFALILAMVGAAIVGCTVWKSDESIQTILFAFGARNDNAANRSPAIANGSIPIAIASLASHAVVSIAAVYFAYQLIRVAERMFLPSRFLSAQSNGEHDVELAKVLVGVTEPSRAASAAMKTMVRELERATKISKAVRGAVGESNTTVNVAPAKHD